MGDFLYKVKAVVDKASFQEGIRELEKLEQTGKRLIKGIAGVGGAAITSATIAGEVAQQELKVAKAIGVSTEALSGWKIACNVAGASASGLVGTLSALENKMQHLKTGTVDSGLAKNLGLLGIGYGDFADMDSESRMRTVFNQANQMKDQQLAATLVGDILGQAGMEYYNSLKLSGKSLEGQLAEAKKLNFVTESNRREAAVFASEMRSVKEAGKSIAMLFGSEIGAALTPTVRRVKNYLIENREAIRRGIEGFAQNIGAVFNAIAGVIGKVAPLIEGLIDKFGGLDKVIVKVGIGFASMKLVQLAGGIKSIVSGVNLLKVAMGGIGKGLIGAGLYFLLDELYARSTGGKTFIWDILLPKLKELKEQLGIDIDFQKMADGLKNMGKELANFSGKAIVASIALLKDFWEILKDLVTLKWDELGGDIKNFFKDWKEGMDNLFDLPSIKEAAGQAYEDTKTETGSAVLGGMAATTTAVEGVIDKTPVLSQVYGAYKKHIAAPVYEYFTGEKLEDGIISPSGKVTSVSPDDWVFAVKDIADLAGAFIPAGVSTNNNMNAPANYVINQTLNVGAGVRAQEVKASAYKGTADALQNSLNNASRIMQLMPGTK